MKLIDKLRRQISILLVLVTAFSGNIVQAATDVTTQSTTTALSASEYVTLVRASAERPGVAFKGDEAGATQHRFTYPIVKVKDTANTAGYCITAFARGVSPSGQEQTFTTVPDGQLDTKDKQLLGIMMAGYPTVKHGWSDEDEYMATQIAIQHFLFQNADKYPNLQGVKFNNDSWTHWANEPIIELAKIIYNQGLANPYVPGTGAESFLLKVIADNNGKLISKDNTLELSLSLEASGSFQTAKLTLPNEIRNIIKSGKGTVTVDGRSVNFKSYILGSDDSYEGIHIQPGDTTVKIVLDKASAEAYVSAPGAIMTGQIQFQAVGGNTVLAYKGNNLNSSNQDYIFTAPGKAEPAATPVQWTKQAEPPNEEPPGKGGLKILKYNQKTNALVSGAIFEIRGVSTTNWDFLVHIQASPGAAIPLPDGGTAVTGVGTVELRDIRPGQYQITEITPPPNFDYCDLGVNSQVVTVVDGGDTGLFPQVRFENNPFASLRIRKIDAVAGSPVNGVILRIRNPLADFDVEMVTANGGVIELSNLPQGNYEISEVFTPNKYIKSNETKVATLRWGETTDITFENTPKTELLVKKIDSETGKALPGAVVRLTKPDTGDVYEDVTYYDGYAVFLNIPAGTYVVEEIKAPDGYILDTTKRTIVVESYKTNEIYVQNSKKPGLVIRKYDEDTGLLLPGAEFSIAKKGGMIIHESITDVDGTIRLDDLDEGWYTVTELAPPKGYLIANEYKDVYLPPNKTMEIKFDNRLRPSLKIVKLDANTNEPVAGAVFHVRKTESDTVSEYITDTTGQILINDLDEAIYTVAEVKAPDGYILETQKKEIELQWGKVKTLIYENTRKPTLIVTKTNALTFEPIQNATFKIEYEGANGGVATIGTFKTDAKGQIVLKHVEPGWYIITETIAAPGFSLPTKPTTRKYLSPGENAYTALPNGMGGTDGENVTIKSGFDFINEQDIVNYPLNSIVIRKTHAVTSEMLAGAAFTLRRVTEDVSGSSGTLIGRYTTDKSGTIVITGLKPGGYIIEEVEPPTNFLLTENAQQQVWLKPDGTSIKECTFSNYPYGAILITKVDAQTNKPLANARFRVTDSSGAVVGNTNGEFITDENGEILIPNVKPGSYVVTEIEAPQNYTVDTTPQTVNVGVDGKTYKVSFKNQPDGEIVIRKLDFTSKVPLAGAEFKVTASDGSVVGTGNGIFKTDANGTVKIPNLPKGSYVLEEITAPAGYILENQTQTVAVDYGKTYTIDFYNKKMSGLQIIKIDSVTKQPLKGAEFTVYKQSGHIVDRYVSDADGVIIIDTLSPGWYKIVETKTLPGYVLDETPKDVEITANQFVKVVFENAPMSGLIIRKVDAATRSPLEGAEFTVKTAGGLLIGVYRSGTDGTANIPTIEPGWYTVTETKAPDGYTLGDNVQTVQITNSKTVTLEFQNRAFGSLVIKKIDEITGKPLSGSNFEVHKQGGGFVGEYTTGNDGTVSILSVEPGWYVVSETKAPAGYTLDSTAKTIEVKPAVPSVATFTNKPLSGIEIVKFDSVTKAPLTGATFTIEQDNGEKIGTYKTDSAGKIIASGLTEGTYILSETAAPNGYILDEAPKTVIVKSGKLTTVEFFNKPLSGLKIIKLNSTTRNPIEGVEFTVTKMSGEKVNNDFNGTTFKTDKTGQIYIPQLEDGYYVVTETRSADGYVLDGEPKTVLIQSGKPTVLEVLNTPMSGLLIVKTDEQTRKPLKGVVFDVRRADGQFVTGSIKDGNQPGTEANSPNRTTSPNGDITGSYTTDNNGRILINALPAGEYLVIERRALDGYELDTDVHSVTVTPGKLTTLQLTNRQKAGLRLVKIDSLTKKPIFNVEFMVFDANNKVVGTFYTDNNGVIDFSGILPEGRYTIRETRAAKGYYLDETPKTVEFVAGKVTEIKWENVPEMGQIQILKKSGDNNEVNGLTAGTPLANAVFEAYDYKTGNLVDRFVSGTDGRAVSSPLPLGRYIIKEVQAPQWYKLSDKQLDVEIEFATQILKMEFLNYSANTGVAIKKTGPVECMPGDIIRYDIKAVQNTSTVPLTDFYWRDTLPTDAVRLNKIVTGSYNQTLKYKVMITTNKGDSRVIADNLSTTKNNVIDCSNASLGLKNDEYVTSFTFVFGTVKAGFAQVEQPQIFVKVLTTLPNQYQFANKVDVGGKYGTEWVVGNSTCLTTIYSKTGPLPRTGY